jgi:CubicO group peptidase (beta-lactamase class C family)
MELRAEYPASGPGAYAIISRGGRVVFSRGFGRADLEHDLPLTSESVVRIASLTKQFTSVAVLRLVQERRLRLEDQLGDVLAKCPSAWRAITIRQLLAQTAGVTDDLTPLYARAMTDMSVDELLALYGDRPLVTKPGANWRYSNLNYWILGKVIETVSNRPYADYVAEHVLARGMTHTRYGSHAAIIPGRASGYELDSKGGWVNARYFSTTLGYSAGGFLSTPGDMVLWYAALSRGEIIAPGTLALALTQQRTTDGRPTGYGLGWYLSEVDGVRVAHHGGSTFGFLSCVYWAPARKVFVGVFRNSSDERGEPDEDARALLKLALERNLGPKLAQP